MGLDDPALNVDGSVPKPVRGVPGEMIVRDRVRGFPPVHLYLILEHTLHGLAIERPVRKIGPNNELKGGPQTITRGGTRSSHPSPVFRFQYADSGEERSAIDRTQGSSVHLFNRTRL